MISGPDCSMKRNISFDRILALYIEIGEILWLHQVVDYLFLIELDCQEERCLAIAISLF